MRKSCFYILLCILSIVLGKDTSNYTFLFCIKPELKPLEISLNRGRLSVGLEELDLYFNEKNILSIEPWIKSASEEDRDGDVYLNRIYRVYLNGSSVNNPEEAINSISQLESTLYAEREYIRRPFYEPNDPSFDNQCSISAIKADLAWDYWNIPNEMPGSKNILLASVDTGVDYTHPDLLDNIWINQGEIPDWVYEAPETNLDNDDFISANEIASFMLTQSDFNGDGFINIRDALYEGSPFIDGIDNDGNGYKDDLLGWDASGENGESDNDPFPKQGSGIYYDGGWAHGTHVAGILGATTDNNEGMSSTVFNGSILSIKASRENGSDLNEPLINDGYSAITYAAKAGYYSNSKTIINCSWGGDGFNSSEQSVVNNAVNMYGAIVVAAAGNGDEDGWSEMYEAHYPASYDGVVSVCAVNCSGIWGNWATYHPTVDLAAPGDAVYSTVIDGAYQTWDGSSMASPNAASAMGLLWSYYPDWTNNDIVEQIAISADSTIYSLSGNDAYEDCKGEEGSYCLGAGMVDVNKAIGQGFSPNIETGDYEFIEIVGDGDGIINPGETGYLRFKLKNVRGWADALNVGASLSSSDSGITILDDYAFYGNILSGDSLYNDDMYKVVFSSDVYDRVVDFRLSVSGNSVDYSYNRSLEYSEIIPSINQSGFPISTFEIRATPLVIDIDGDGEKEMIVCDRANSIRVYSANGTEVINDIFPYDTGNQIWGSPSAADMDGDGNIDFAVVSKSKSLFLFDKNGLKARYNSNKYLVGTPAIGNVDSDADLEVVFGGYANNNQIYAINPDGTQVDGYPIDIGDKTKAGVALYDFNGNGIDDIVVGTDNSKMYLIYDDGSIAPGFPYSVQNKIQAAPSVYLIEGSPVIFFGSNDKNFYAINSDGSERFMVATGDKVQTSPSFLDYNGAVYTFFGSNDDKVYAVNAIDGSALEGWPKDVTGSVVGSIIFANLDGDGEPEIISLTDKGYINIYNLSGNSYRYSPLENDFPFSGSPMVSDIDGDSDLEIIAGSGGNLVMIDLKTSGLLDGYWSEFRGGFERRGSSSLGGCMNSSYCNYDSDAVWDDGSCSIASNQCSDGRLGCDCNDTCNGIDILDCNGDCAGGKVVDVCGKCGGDGPLPGFNCEGEILSIEKDLFPFEFGINRVYPNPFNPIASINYGLPESSQIMIRAYNIHGKEIAVLYNGYRDKGYHKVIWNASSFSSGLYFIRIESGNYIHTQKVLLVK